jgi:hypothetical protein
MLLHRCRRTVVMMAALDATTGKRGLSMVFSPLVDINFGFASRIALDSACSASLPWPSLR